MATKHMPFTEEQVTAAYHTSVVAAALSLGVQLKDEGKAYRVPGNAGLFLFKHGCSYFHHDGGLSGSGIDFLIKYCGVETKARAIGLVLGTGGNAPQYGSYSDVKSTERGEFALPTKAANIKKIYWYLLEKRGLDKEIVSSLIAEKKIFQADKGNCVFVGFDSEKTARYATARGTGDTKYQGEIKNSDKSYPFHIKGKGSSLVVCESPITAMSYATLMKQHGRDWQQTDIIALGGRSPLALNWFLKENPQITKIVFALDNDFLGLNAKKTAFENYGQLSAAKMKEDYTKLGYSCMIHTPHLNDFNDDLVETQKGCTDLDAMRERQLEDFLKTWQPDVGFLESAEEELEGAEP